MNYARIEGAMAGSVARPEDCRAWHCLAQCSPPPGAQSCRHTRNPIPTGPIKLIVAVLPGGPMDVMGRLIAQHLSSTFGQVFVENRAGAGTTLGAKAWQAPTGWLHPAVGECGDPGDRPHLVQERRLRFRCTSFRAGGVLASVPYVLIVSPSLPVRTVPELVAYAKAHPGKLSFGVPNAAPPHMLAAWFKALTGTDVVIVPYKGALGGAHRSAGRPDSGRIRDHIGAVQPPAGQEDQRARGRHASAAAGSARGADDDRKRLPGFIASSWTSVMAPAGTPKDIVGKLNESINAGSTRRRCRRASSSSRPMPARNAGGACDLHRR
jgi:tripartite-type tricarboxylate transporter receptor subunit TctC